MYPYISACSFIAAGLVLLLLGAEGLVGGSLKISKRLNVSPLLAGLTVVALGTSTPELGVSIIAALNGNSEIALSNVIGSNIANATLIVGIGALLRPFSSQAVLTRRDFPVLLFSSVLAWVLASHGGLGRSFGIIGLFLFSCYLFYLYKARETVGVVLEELEERAPSNSLSILKEVVMILGGLLGLVIGSKIFLRGATEIAALLAVPELFIGLTLTAVGTSLPEIATTVSATRRGQGDIVMGNVMGSNIANLCLVLALTALIVPIPVPGKVLFRDFPVMVLSTSLLLPMIRQGRKITRFDGAMLLFLYFVYILMARR